jgi:predicted lactoylglutathione lyase
MATKIFVNINPHEPTDYGWMYHHGFQDPDGHLWEIIYMDMSKIDQALQT